MTGVIVVVLAFMIFSVCSVGYADILYEKSLEHWDFATAQDTLGWDALHSVALLTVGNGVLQMRITDSDPYIGGPNIEIMTSDFQYIRVTMRSEVPGNGQIFWATGPSAREARFEATDAANFNVIADGEFHTYYILPFWETGVTVYRIRIDMPEGAGKLVEIKDVAMVERNVTGDLPTKPYYDFSAPGTTQTWMPYQDVESMLQENGVLKVSVSGKTPAMVSPPFKIAARNARFLTLQASVKEGYRAEVWYTTGTGFPPPNRHSFQLIPDGKFHTYNIDLSQVRGYDGVITRLALALVDAGQEAQWSLRSVQLADAPSGPGEAMITSFEIGSAVALAGEVTKVYCEVTNVGGELIEQAEVELACPVKIARNLRQSIASLDASQSVVCEWNVIFPERETPEPVTIEARLLAGGKVIGIRSASAVVSVPPSRRRADLTLENKQVKLILPQNAYGYGVGLLYVRGAEGWLPVASMKNLGTLSEADGEVHELFSKSGMFMGGKLVLPIRHQQWNGRISFTLSPEVPFIEVSSSISCSEEAELTCFSLPDLLVGDGAFGKDRDIGLFPGLEYLLPGERSSGLDFCAVPVNNRLVPHPNKVTIPFMSIIHDGAMAGMMWDPLQRWDGVHSQPCAKFASPNFVDDQRNHLMGLFVPSIPEWTDENALKARKPYDLSPGQEITLTAKIFAAQGDDVDDVIKLWFDSTDGVPMPSEMPYSYGEHVRATMMDYTTTAWIPEESKWHRTIDEPWGPLYIPAHALHLMWEIQRGKLPVAELEKAEEILDAAIKKQLETSQNIGHDIAFYRGPAEQLTRPLNWLARLSRQIRDDGTVPFQPDVKHSLFGKRGDTSSGHTARILVDVFRYALASGNQEAIELGLKGLKYLDSQMRPEGAQTWELPLHVPDVLAAAHVIDCYVAAYELTKNKKYLEQACLWAYRGLPFIYLWNPADRPIMRYGSIPVFGETWFASEWFGNIVQWNGLVYANSLLGLAEHDTSRDWRRIAEGITISAIQQQRPIDHSTYKFRDNIPDCGHAGMYPDAYSAVTGTDTYHWCLSGDRITENAYKLMGIDPAIKHTIVWSEDEKNRAHISSVAYIQDAVLSYDGLKFTATFHEHPYAEAHYIVAANVAKPVSVSKNGEALNRVNDLDAAPEGYQWMPKKRVIIAKVVQDSSSVLLEIQSARD